MLTKLLKYEFRASFRELLPLYVALVGVAALVRPAYFRGIDNELTGITMMVYSALMIAIVVISILTIVQRFTRTMLGREAYLMLTLPVPVSVHVAAKLIVGVTVMIAGVLVATLSFFVMTVNSSMLILLKYFLQEAAQLLETLLRQNAYVLLAEFLLLWVMLLVQGLLTIYVSACIGHLAERNRGIFSVLSYILLSSVINTVSDLIYDILVPSNAVGWSGPSVYYSLNTAWLIPPLVTSLVFCIVLFKAVTWILENRLNLD